MPHISVELKLSRVFILRLVKTSLFLTMWNVSDFSRRHHQTPFHQAGTRITADRPCQWLLNVGSYLSYQLNTRFCFTQYVLWRAKRLQPFLASYLCFSLSSPDSRINLAKERVLTSTTDKPATVYKVADFGIKVMVGSYPLDSTGKPRLDVVTCSPLINTPRC
ncbi:hypothetical protein NB725_004437 [Pantoea ananatis]|nr:hypothetical protein [Pantoea ananatis]MCW0341735.1 hypothetical protein [Pantoea ananatis]MCW0360200.1 hypothetical protein [Pantoea ananatis]MCW0364827.1 hypothetical protein [Pantoea ananatis]